MVTRAEIRTALTEQVEHFDISCYVLSFDEMVQIMTDYVYDQLKIQYGDLSEMDFDDVLITEEMMKSADEIGLREYFSKHDIAKKYFL